MRHLYRVVVSQAPNFWAWTVRMCERSHGCTPLQESSAGEVGESAWEIVEGWLAGAPGSGIRYFEHVTKWRKT